MTANKRTVTVGQAPYLGDTNAPIQKAIEHAAAMGGAIVHVPAGVYTLHAPIQLRSKVHLVGEEGTIFKNAPSTSSAIADFIGYGHYEFTTDEPEKFHVGMGVHLLDHNAVGFYTTVATIIDRDDDKGVFYLDRMANHDYLPTNGARVITVYPLIEAQHVTQASVSNIKIDGNKTQNENINGCRGGGVFLIQSNKITIDNVQVTDFNGDALSFQQCTDITVKNCQLHQNTGTGLHPGSGSVRYVFENNHVHHNGNFGLFYCLRTSHGICRDNTFNDNGNCGISIGERDTDHLIENNKVICNAGPGLEFRQPIRTSGDRVQFTGNTLTGNCTDREMPQFEIHIPAGLKDIHLAHNTIKTAEGVEPIYIAADTANISLDHNTINGKALTIDHVQGGATDLTQGEPKTPFEVGPGALKSNDARHLAIDSLEDWQI